MQNEDLQKHVVGLYAPMYPALHPDPGRKPLLAHYTAIDVAKQIIENNEVWFSNPLYMNDLEEIRFGINETIYQLHAMQEVKDCFGSNTEARTRLLYFYEMMYSDHDKGGKILDVYVFCLSEHTKDDTDGLLSMWRAYGAQGNGAALVFDSSKLRDDPPDAPLLLSEVKYGTRAQRSEQISNMIRMWCEIVKTHGTSDQELYIAAEQLFILSKLYALTNKHSGFSEEKEWRIIYIPEYDVMKNMTAFLSYHFGPTGIEPKLKFKVAPVPPDPSSKLSIDYLLEKIILGPTISSPLALLSFQRMLGSMQKQYLVDKVVASGIPLRRL